MPINDFSVGRDIAIDLFDANSNAIVSFNIRTGFEAKPLTTEIKIKGLDGTTRFGYLPDGYQGSIDFERAGPELENFILGLEATYFAGNNVKASQITETITEPGGTVSQYRYTGVMVKLAESGAWKGDASIKQKLDWCASRKIQVL
jgi:hypothetical protein